MIDELPWWQPSGILPIPVRFEPAPGNVRAQHGAALRESLQDRVDVKADEQAKEER